MSFSALNPSIRSQAWRQIFAGMIEDRREALGRSQEEAARLAGMESSEWAAIEAGYLPEDVARLRSVAAALEVRFEDMALLVFICQDAWAA
jgi:transcriptional regulator with XRE-family HTH domain